MQRVLEKNHEAAASRQLAPVHVMPYFMTYCQGGKTDKRGKRCCCNYEKQKCNYDNRNLIYLELRSVMAPESVR